VNSRAKRADTGFVRQPTDSYFVRIHPDPPSARGTDSQVQAGRAGLGAPGPVRRRRRRRGISGRAVFLTLLLIGVGTWAIWAQQRPGGISGTIDSWISNVRGDVAQVSSDPDVAKARRYFNAQYKQTGAYPQLSDADLTAAAGVGLGVSLYWCNSQAVVLQGASGGGTVSRLLLGGHDLGAVDGRHDCPVNMVNPAPWKKP
jgi:hypothetical protein